MLATLSLSFLSITASLYLCCMCCDVHAVLRCAVVYVLVLYVRCCAVLSVRAVLCCTCGAVVCCVHAVLRCAVSVAQFGAAVESVFAIVLLLAAELGTVCSASGRRSDGR